MGYDRTDVGGIDAVALTGFFGTIEQRTDQDRIPTPTRPQDITRADISAKDFQIRATGNKLVKQGKLEFGLDLNGRFDLEAHDIFIQYNLAGDVVSETDNLSIDSAKRVDTGFFFQGESPLGAHFSASGGVRFDYVSNTNRGGYFGDQSVSNGAVAGFGSITAGPFSIRRSSRRSAAGFATRRSPIASIAVRAGAASSPGIRSWSRSDSPVRPGRPLRDDSIPRRRLLLQLPHQEPHRALSDDARQFIRVPQPRRGGDPRLRSGNLGEFRRRLMARRHGAIGRGEALDDDADLDDISPDTLAFGLRKAFSKSTSWPSAASPSTPTTIVPAQAKLTPPVTPISTSARAGRRIAGSKSAVSSRTCSIRTTTPAPTRAGCPPRASTDQ